MGSRQCCLVWVTFTAVVLVFAATAPPRVPGPAILTATPPAVPPLCVSRGFPSPGKESVDAALLQPAAPDDWVPLDQLKNPPCATPSSAGHAVCEVGKNGLLQWRPRTCTLTTNGTFDDAILSERLKNGTLLLIGDSLTAQHFRALTTCHGAEEGAGPCAAMALTPPLSPTAALAAAGGSPALARTGGLVIGDIKCILSERAMVPASWRPFFPSPTRLVPPRSKEDSFFLHRSPLHETGQGGGAAPG